MCECAPCRCRSWLAYPPDALTLLMMKSDGVSESSLHVLLFRVAKARAGEPAPCLTLSGNG
jgi:hypothetical protein